MAVFTVINQNNLTKMKKLLTLALLLGLGISVNAQDWKLSMDSAKTLASQENINIILVFAGSDWCGPCIKLEKNIWESEEFQKTAKESWVMLKADFPRKKANRLSKEQTQENERLAEQYNPNGYFPLVLVLDAAGKVLGTTGFKDFSPSEYITHLQSFE